MENKYSSLVVGLVLPLITHAAPLEPVLDCHLNQVMFKGKVAYLNKAVPDKVPQVYLMKNTSADTLLLDHTKGNVGASAGWASTLSPNHWSVMAISQRNFNVNCAVMIKGNRQVGDCHALQICQPSSQGLTIQSSGNYWVVENKSWEEIVKILSKKGVSW